MLSLLCYLFLTACFGLGLHMGISFDYVLCMYDRMSFGVWRDVVWRMTGTDTTPSWKMCCVRMSRCSFRQVPSLLGGSVAGGIPAPGGTGQSSPGVASGLSRLDRQTTACVLDCCFISWLTITKLVAMLVSDGNNDKGVLWVALWLLSIYSSHPLYLMHRGDSGLCL